MREISQKWQEIFILTVSTVNKAQGQTTGSMELEVPGVALVVHYSHIIPSWGSGSQQWSLRAEADCRKWWNPHNSEPSTPTIVMAETT
jgi:hypothetical protein